jgi:hypothetical protein
MHETWRYLTTTSPLGIPMWRQDRHTIRTQLDDGLARGARPRLCNGR